MALCYLSLVAEGLFMKKKIVSLLVLIPLLSMTGCGENTVSSERTSAKDGSDIHDLYSAFTALAKAKNYQVNIEVSSESGSAPYSYNVTYTDRYVYCDKSGAEWGYALSSQGAYRVDTVSTGFVASELLFDETGTSYSDLIGSGLFASFADFVSDGFTNSDQNLVIKNKKNQLAALKFVGLSTSDFFDLTSVEASIGSKGLLSSFYLDVTVAKVLRHVTVSAFGDAKLAALDSFVASAAPFEAPVNLAMARVLFKAKNYSRSVIDYSDNLTNDGTEHFLPDYYYGDYNANGAKQGAASAGWMGINHKKYKGEDLYGTYLFSLTSSGVSLNTTGVYNVSPDISSKGNVNYPSNLVLWERLELANQNGDENHYQDNDYATLVDFCSNYQLTTSLSAINASPTRLAIQMANMGAKNQTVTFKLYYQVSGSDENYVIFPMFDFGRSNLGVVDGFIRTSLS